MKQIILAVLSVLLGLIFINAGLNKFFNYIPMPEELPEEMLKDFQAFNEIVWLMPLVAVAEIIGGILIMVPRWRALGALILFPVMVGILLTHIIVEPAGLIMVIVYWAIFLWIIYENKHKYDGIVSK